MHSAAIEVRSLSKIYRTSLFPRNSVIALDHVSFQAPTGSVFALLGPNRAGKSTLLKILLSICRPTSGEAFRLGMPATFKQTLARIGFMHENQAFPRYLAAPALLDYYGALAGVTPAACRVRGRQLLERVGLADRLHEPIANFSKGMIQRLALAQALLNQPDLLILDEPTEGLDQLARTIIYQVVSEQKSAGKTTLLVSHILEDVERMCDRCVVLVKGKVAFEGEISGLRRGPDGELRPLAEAVTHFYQANES